MIDFGLVARLALKRMGFLETILSVVVMMPKFFSCLIINVTAVLHEKLGKTMRSHGFSRNAPKRARKGP